MEMTVDAFLASLPNGAKTCYRLTNELENHRGVEYRDGVNRLPSNEKFNPSGDCTSGGLYFFTKDQLKEYAYNAANVGKLTWIREVSFNHPELQDARIFMNPGGRKFKCDKFFLGERKEFFINDYVDVTPQNVMTFHGRHIRWTRELALVAVNRGGWRLQYIPVSLRDRDVCLAAVNQIGMILDDVPDVLRDRDMCLAAVNQDGRALQYVPDALRDREICEAAVRQDGYALRYVSESLRDRDMCMMAVERYGRVLEYVPVELRDHDICLAAVNQDRYALQYVPESLQDEVKQCMNKQ